jgi:lycopene cyclase domain-containing protein
MCRRYSDILWLNRKVVFIVTSAGVLYISILEPVAIYWKAWSFNSDKILGLYIGNLPIEEIVAAVFVYFAIACFIISRIARGK